jgi:ABC-type lipoprotein export system ATPase subunit
VSVPPFGLLRSVSKTYRSGSEPVEALRDISLSIPEGAFTLLLGPSGSGKTTLLNLMAALDRPDEGDIIVKGQNIARLSLTAAARYRNRCIGIVFQSYNLLPQLTALENVLLPMIAQQRSDRRRAMDLLSEVGLADRSLHRPATLSGGEQQRVAIARALANDPSLILADEPTGNLDEHNADLVRALLLRSCREHRKTLIMVTHDRQATQWADRVLELQAGRLIGPKD